MKSQAHYDKQDEKLKAGLLRSMSEPAKPKEFVPLNRRVTDFTLSEKILVIVGAPCLLWWVISVIRFMVNQ